MILSETQSAYGLWVLVPDRLPFIRAALGDLSMRRRRTLPQAPIMATANATRRQVRDSAVAVLPFYGVAVQRTDAVGEALGLLSLWHFTKAFRAALADDAVGAILIDVDSPGGSVYGIAELAGEIFRARTRRPIAAIANSLAASGAYWIASAASEFWVTPGGEVGSIGVVAAHQDTSKALAKAGVESTLISAGKYKTEGNPFQPLGADARQHIQNRVDDCYRMFVGAVAKHRGEPESAVRSGMGQGRLLDADRAKRENMVDGVATFDEVIDRLRLRVSPRPFTRNANPLTGPQRLLNAAGAPLRREIELLAL